MAIKYFCDKCGEEKEVRELIWDANRGISAFRKELCLSCVNLLKEWIDS